MAFKHLFTSSYEENKEKKSSVIVHTMSLKESTPCTIRANDDKIRASFSCFSDFLYTVLTYKISNSGENEEVSNTVGTVPEQNECSY